ncbi:hypothetical protein EST38_g5240 [Candolleomyces aberdarensis]|uniref:Uncharacterized protein n=1 Tax=Candolleomyces aberdarensis TaxID=2316362 RepID=A0A4Q2DL20_9AGAR|nr:hypothetical protein EST38_g5240 [Candolleomyces aberdarensis]
MQQSSAEVSLPSTNMAPDPSNADRKETLFQQLAVAKTVLSQAVDLVDNHLQADDQLSVQSQYMPGSTIGKHLRHARDHFALLLDCMKQPPYVLSYDIRIRNTPMETSLSGARSALLEIIKQLEEVVPKVKLDEPLTLHAITPHMHEFQSTFGRELWFASLHCVHHWSMVRVIAGEIGIKLHEDFGFAPSTLVYQGENASSVESQAS